MDRGPFLFWIAQGLKDFDSQDEALVAAGDAWLVDEAIRFSGMAKESPRGRPFTAHTGLGTLSTVFLYKATEILIRQLKRPFSGALPTHQTTQKASLCMKACSCTRGIHV